MPAETDQSLEGAGSLSAESRTWRELNHGLKRMVQLAGLEPATSCSTNRRSNQLSYNCILTAPKQGSRTGGKLGATLRFGKAAKRLKSMNLVDDGLS
ncbi:MAG: hypothetical protein JWQ24_3053 [Tardiphaga sp.]|nr:hypothetical protein [Tardiphaga sp.]